MEDSTQQQPPAIPAEAVEAAARGMAILDDHDGCFLEVDAWNAQEEWEREAWPDNYPGSAIEDCAYWIARARTALEAAAPHMLSHEREQTRLAHLDAMVNRDTAARLEQAIAGVLELAAPQRHMVSAAEIREWIANALEVEK